MERKNIISTWLFEPSSRKPAFLTIEFSENLLAKTIFWTVRSASRTSDLNDLNGHQSVDINGGTIKRQLVPGYQLNRHCVEVENDAHSRISRKSILIYLCVMNNCQNIRKGEWLITDMGKCYD